ncbi:MAG: DUF1569 domain-containing protein [Pseudomonadota bacterium]
MKRADRQRRRLLLTGLAGVAGVAAPAQAAQGRELRFSSLSQALEELERMPEATALDKAGTWSWAQTLQHCAQSIEYSMVGYPQYKSPLFQRTLGAFAFKVFALRGHMSHNLREPIPGAPPYRATTSTRTALRRLRSAIEAFHDTRGELHPHFAYGVLSKAEYEQAHAMHLADHFAEFVARR